jgi:hypothetical protein
MLMGRNEGGTAMALQNRVTPFNRIVSVPARGLFTGNRGVLHGKDRRLSNRRWTTRAWIVCLLNFKGRSRRVMTPGRYTELFFLDEASAFAAGHRPCAECRRADYLRFKTAWVRANLPERTGSQPAVGELDRVLHADRLAEDGRQRRFAARTGELPDGTLVSLPESDDAWLIADGRARRWSWEGYGDPERWSGDREVEVLTPRSTVRALAAGYRPVLHPTAGLR